MAHHHLKAQPGTVHWGFFDAGLKPILHVRSGDTVTVDTLSGEPEDLPDPSLGFTIVPGHHEVHAANGQTRMGPHFLTGPIFVEDAEPGDVLEVRLLDISLRQDWGWNLQQPLLGTLPEDFPETRRLHIPLDRQRCVTGLGTSHLRHSALFRRQHRQQGTGCRYDSLSADLQHWRLAVTRGRPRPAG